MPILIILAVIVAAFSVAIITEKAENTEMVHKNE